MIKLVEITEENQLAVRRMTLGEEQKTDPVNAGATATENLSASRS